MGTNTLELEQILGINYLESELICPPKRECGSNGLMDPFIRSYWENIAHYSQLVYPKKRYG